MKTQLQPTFSSALNQNISFRLRRFSVPFMAFAGVLAFLLGASLTARAETPDEQYAFASGLYSGKLYGIAVGKLREFIAANPTHPKTVFASYQLGAALYRVTNEKGAPEYSAVAAAYEKALLKPAPTPQIAAAARFELGDAQFNLKKYDAAIKSLGDYLKSTPPLDKSSAAWAQYWIGQSYEALKKPVEARAAYQKVVASYGDNADVAPYAQNTLGILAAQAGDSKAAIAAFAALIKKYPQSEVAPEARLRLGDAYLANKNFAEAQTSYNAVIADAKAAEFKKDAQLGLADAYFGDKKFPEAASEYARVLTSLPLDDKTRGPIQLQLGNSYFNDKKYDGAVAAYAPILQNADAETAANALYFSASSLQALKRPAEAIPQFRKLVESYPKNALAPKAALRLGDAYADANDNAGAIAAYKSVALKFPTSPSAKEAQKALIELEGETANTQLAAIEAAYNAKNWAQTAKLSQAFLDKKPNPAAAESALYLLADAKRQAGDNAGAASAFRALLTAYPQGETVGDARLGLAYVLLDTKNWSGAEASARAGLLATEKSAKAGELRDRLNLALGESLLSGNKAADAALVFARVEKSGVEELSSQGIYGGALALEKSKQWVPAATKWSQYAGVSADAATKSKAYLRQGLALRDAKNFAPALTAFDSAIAADPKSDAASQALYESAWAARELKKPAEETLRWTRLTTEFPASKWASEAYFQRAEVLYDAKSFDEAIAAYRLVQESSEFGPDAQYKLGSALFNAQNWAQAAPAFDKASGAKKEFSLESSFWAGESWRKAGNLATAKTRYDAFLQGLSTRPAADAAIKQLQLLAPRARLGIGLSFAAAKDWARAISTYQAALPSAGGATAAELNFRLGEAFAQQSKWANASEQFIKVYVSFPDSSFAEEAQWNAAQAMEKNNDKTSAITVYKALAARAKETQFTTQAKARLTALNAN